MEPTKKRIELLKEKTLIIRQYILKMSYFVEKGCKAHPGPALSISDILTALYFEYLNVFPDDPNNPGRDRLVLSKGHAYLALYAVLAEKGFFDKSLLLSVRREGSILQGHPDMNKVPGVDMTTGSLGNGLGTGVGMALAAKIDNRGYKTVVIIGDGESQEGVVWEAAECAVKYKLSNLVAIIDKNNFQGCGSIEKIMPGIKHKERWEAFGWNVIEIDGHDHKEILSSFEEIERNRNNPLCIIASTVKGRGLSFMENDNSWHQKTLTEDEYNKGCEELGMSCDKDI